jgi:hypothetical protein
MTEEEKRAFALLQSIASLRMDGVEISGFALDLMRRWAREEIEFEEVITTLVNHYSREERNQNSDSDTSPG